MVEPIKVVLEDSDVLHDVTPEEYKHFQSACLKYQKLFGIIDWDIYFVLEDLSEDEELANISWCFTGHSVRISLSNKLPTGEDYPTMISNIARHEIIHLLIARLQEYVQRRSILMEDVTEAVESLVRLIDNVYKAGAEAVCQCQTQVCQCDQD